MKQVFNACGHLNVFFFGGGGNRPYTLFPVVIRKLLPISEWKSRHLHVCSLGYEPLNESANSTKLKLNIALLKCKIMPTTNV